ncbi:MAG: hypothetical protein IPH53_21230 [Flavobacteriales bacterium]|nr:hypothetical protein [Flavobacteriales bacterium]
MIIATTDGLVLRGLEERDAEMILLLNSDPEMLRVWFEEGPRGCFGVFMLANRLPHAPRSSTRRSTSGCGEVTLRHCQFHLREPEPLDVVQQLLRRFATTCRMMEER